jgi:hypothetical protein
MQRLATAGHPRLSGGAKNRSVESGKLEFSNPVPVS